MGLLEMCGADFVLIGTRVFRREQILAASVYEHEGEYWALVWQVEQRFHDEPLQIILTKEQYKALRR
jgi:hypothetical protein